MQTHRLGPTEQTREGLGPIGLVHEMSVRKGTAIKITRLSRIQKTGDSRIQNYQISGKGTEKNH